MTARRSVVADLFLVAGLLGAGSASEEESAVAEADRPARDGGSKYVRLEHFRTKEAITVPGDTLTDYKRVFIGYFKAQYPGIENDTVGFRSLIESLARKTERHNGTIRGYSFLKSLELYNLYAEIAAHVDGLSLPARFRESLKEYYARDIIMDARTYSLDVEKIKARLSGLPDDGRAVQLKEGQDLLYYIVAGQYHWFKSLDSKDQLRALQFVDGMNPHIDAGTSRDSPERVGAVARYLGEGGERTLQTKYRVDAAGSYMLFPSDRTLRRMLEKK